MCRKNEQCNMKRLLFSLLAVVMVVGAMAQEQATVPGQNKMAFTVEGPEETYNQIRVVNHTSVSDFECRVVFLNDDNTVQTLYGVYRLKGNGDKDSNAKMVRRGTRIGIQMPNDFPTTVTFSIEYKDYPFYDAILIHINEQSSGYDDSF